jgi:hypothetical protein
MVIYTDKTVRIFIIGKRVITPRIADISQLNKYIDLSQLSFYMGFGNTNPIRVPSKRTFLMIRT